MTRIPGNYIPETVKSVHLIGICGTAMGALACLLREMGFLVTGSDQNIYPPMSTFLEERGIRPKKGFSGRHLAHNPDLVVVGNAVTRANPEARALRERGLPFCSMPQAVNRFLAFGKKILLVTGTHGKTTTASLLAHVLFEVGADPSFLIGGILKNFQSNYRLGKGEYVVLEGDEYDTAYFDKGPKFLHYDAHTAILTSMEFDHADIFTDFAHVKKAFRGLVEKLSPRALLIACAEDPQVAALSGIRNSGVLRYGRTAEADWHPGEIRAAGRENRFEPTQNGRSFGQWTLPLLGHHNVLNALSVIAAAHHLGLPMDAVKKALLTFKGVKRRQEIRGVKRGILVMDDFAHHPTAVRETVSGVRKHFNTGRLIAVFEPRTNTSMRNIFQNVYPKAFDAADRICIRKPPLLKKIPKGKRFSSKKLVADLLARGKDAHYFEDTDGIIDYLVETAKPGDLILIMSNGGFDNIHERLLARL